MASNNEYKRYFIILQEDDKGYEISSGKTPTGYVKIEVKNNKVKLNAFIQNVKLDDRIEYRLLLVASIRKLAVDIGKIVIDGSGRGELSYELESDNVMKSGVNIADFNIAAVTAGTAAPLSGYTGRDKQEWKGKYDIMNSPKNAEEARKDKKPPVEEIVPPAPPAPQLPPEIEVPSVPVAPPMPEMPPQPVIPVPPEPVIPPEPIKPPVPVEMPPIIVVAPKPEPEVTQIIENKVEIEILVPKCPPMAPMEEPCDLEEEEEEEEEKKKKPECGDIKEFYCEDEDEDSDSESDSDDHEHKHGHKHEHERDEEHHDHDSPPYYSGNMYGRLKKILRRLRRYEPFEEERECDWFRVGSDIYELNQVAVPYMGHMLPLGYPFMSEGCSMLLDRKDYIIGVSYEEKDGDDDRYIKHVFFGIPALYSKRNEQYYKSRGYSQFRPHKSKGYGYFIMCLDIEKGTLCHMD